MRFTQGGYQLGVTIYSSYGTLNQSVYNRAYDILRDASIEGALVDQLLQSEIGNRILGWTFPTESRSSLSIISGTLNRTWKNSSSQTEPSWARMI